MRKNRQDRFKVSADIRNIVVDSSESAIKVKLINGAEQGVRPYLWSAEPKLT
jgi:hypothetical protein